MAKTLPPDSKHNEFAKIFALYGWRNAMKPKVTHPPRDFIQSESLISAKSQVTANFPSVTTSSSKTTIGNGVSTLEYASSEGNA